jgi:hypothetical protein
MPHKYLYQIKNDYDGFESLIKREAAITKAWLELKLGKAVSQYLIKQCQTDDKAIGTIWELIMESFDRWDFPKDVPLIENLTLDDTHET